MVWFYLNNLYFPYNAQDLAKVSFEDFAKPIFDSLDRVSDPTLESAVSNEQLPQGNLMLTQQNTDGQGDDMADNEPPQTQQSHQ